MTSLVCSSSTQSFGVLERDRLLEREEDTHQAHLATKAGNRAVI